MSLTEAQAIALIEKHLGFYVLTGKDAEKPADPINLGHQVAWYSTDQGKLYLPHNTVGGLVWKGAGASSLADLDDVDDSIPYAAQHFIAGSAVPGIFTARLITPPDLPSLPASQTTSGEFDAARLPVMVGDAGSGGTRGAVPQPATGDATKFLRGDGTWQYPNLSSVVVMDRKAQNTAQATYTSGAFRTVALNYIPTYSNTFVSGVSIASNRVTLPAGTYNAYAEMTVLAATTHRPALRFYNYTAAAAFESESPNHLWGNNVRQNVRHVDSFTLSVSSEIELQLYNSINTSAYGTMNRSGRYEVYAYCMFTRIRQ